MHIWKIFSVDFNFVWNPIMYLYQWLKKGYWNAGTQVSHRSQRVKVFREKIDFELW